VAYLFPLLWFVFADPEKLRDCKVGEGWVTGELNESGGADFFRQLNTLFFGADIAPDKRGANGFAGSVERDRAMHLSGKTNARDLVTGNLCLGKSLADGNSASPPPVARVLLSPANLRRGKILMFFSGRAQQMTILVNHEHAGTASSNIYAKDVHKGSIVWQSG
jgi:hypothetical protein